MNCIVCKKELTGLRKKFCSSKCQFKDFNARPQRKEWERQRRYKKNKFVKKPGDVYDQTGEKNPNWKGGISKNNMRYRKKFTEKNRNKIRCQEKALRNYKTGNILKEPCKVCGSKKSEMHHPDYSKPLEVVWLCRKHHNIENKKRKNGEK